MQRGFFAKLPEFPYIRINVLIMKNFPVKTLFVAIAALALCAAACCPKDTPRQRAGHVVMIGIDGWAAEGVRQAPEEDLPNLQYLMQHGAWTLSKRSVMPSASAINWASTFNGVPTEMHGFDKWNSTHGTIPSTSDNGHGIPPTIFTLVREQHPQALTGLLYDWDGVGPVADTLAMSWHHFVKTYSHTDGVIFSLSEYTDIATDYIKQNKPEFFCLYYGTLDETGHKYGWYGPEYMEHQKLLDTEIGRVMDALKEAGIFEDTILILTSDHGGNGHGHGGFSLLELETPFVVSGKGIKQGYEFPITLMQYDTPAVAADALGIRLPAEWRGRPYPEIYVKP